MLTDFQLIKHFKMFSCDRVKCLEKILFYFSLIISKIELHQFLYFNLNILLKVYFSIVYLLDHLLAFLSIHLMELKSYLLLIDLKSYL